MILMKGENHKHFIKMTMKQLQIRDNNSHTKVKREMELLKDRLGSNLIKRAGEVNLAQATVLRLYRVLSKTEVIPL